MNRRDASDVHHHLALTRKHHASLSEPSDAKADPEIHTEEDSATPIDRERSSLSVVKKAAHRFMLPQIEKKVG
jgi:hypothetical protein